MLLFFNNLVGALILPHRNWDEPQHHVDWVVRAVPFTETFHLFLVEYHRRVVTYLGTRLKS